MSSDEQQLREELQQLREDYKTLEHNFDIMSEGYQESLGQGTPQGRGGFADEDEFHSADQP